MQDIQPFSVAFLTTFLTIILVISFWSTSIFAGYIQSKPFGAQRLADFIYKAQLIEQFRQSSLLPNTRSVAPLVTAGDST
jgi:hypothetical protein